MSTVTVTAENFRPTIESNDIVLLDWWAAWCGPCRVFGPIYEQAADEHPDLVFGKIDTEAEQKLSAALGVMSIPTLMIFREGVLVFSQPGALPAPVLAELIAKARELDMGEVHRAVAAQAGAS